MKDDCGEDFDCPSLLCEEVVDLTIEKNPPTMLKRKRNGEGKVFIQWEDEEAGGETLIENKDGEEVKEEKHDGIGFRNSCDLSNPVHLGYGETGLNCPPVPNPLLHSSQPPVPPHSPMHSYSLPQQYPQPLQMEITEVHSTERFIRYSTTFGDIGLMFSHPLPPEPKKKLRVAYSSDQLEYLEALFLEDRYPDKEKRTIIATAVGVPLQSITNWFQNRRTRWKKKVQAEVEHGQSRAGYYSSPTHQPVDCTLPTLAPHSEGAPSFSGHFATEVPQLTSTAPSFPTLSNQTVPSHSNLLAGLNSPGQSRVRDGGQDQVSSQGWLTTYNPANPTPPLLDTLAHTRPLFLDAVEDGSSMAHCDSQSLQKDTSLTSSQHNLYQLLASDSTSQPQHQPQASLPRMACLTPNPPYSNPTSSLTFGPRRTSTTKVTYSTTYFQSRSTKQIMPQSAGHRGGITAHQSYPLGNMYSQPAIHQRAQCPSTYPASPGGTQDHQPPSSIILPPPSFFSQGDHRPSHASSTCLSDTHTHNTLLPSQASPAYPESPPVPPRVKIEDNSSPYLDFSPHRFYT